MNTAAKFKLMTLAPLGQNVKVKEVGELKELFEHGYVILAAGRGVSCWHDSMLSPAKITQPEQQEELTCIPQVAEMVREHALRIDDGLC